MQLIKIYVKISLIEEAHKASPPLGAVSREKA